MTEFDDIDGVLKKNLSKDEMCDFARERGKSKEWVMELYRRWKKPEENTEKKTEEKEPEKYLPPWVRDAKKYERKTGEILTPADRREKFPAPEQGSEEWVKDRTITFMIGLYKDYDPASYTPISKKQYQTFLKTGVPPIQQKAL